MINSIDLTRLHNANYLQFQKDFLEIISRNNPTVLQIETNYNGLSDKINELEDLFKKVLANPIFQELLVLDESRDYAVNVIYYATLAYSYH
ncbi:hypothetical protein [Chryseobacterium sp. FH1]|uniref:hypothetical protein n=1 Tax=Chryseobacterium sp. FH1 TaxID=1233951 RepID=UPI000A4E2462|nr:hypothetical protein [Chryseobacterium sp. FH1]